jgi:hypothetical protein
MSSHSSSPVRRAHLRPRAIVPVVVVLTCAGLHTAAPASASTDEVGISVDDVTVTEPRLGGDVPMVFTVSLDRPAPAPVTVDYQALNPDSLNKEWVSTHGTLTFAEGEQAKNVVVTARGDFNPDEADVFEMTLSNPVGAVIADGTGVGTILNVERWGWFQCHAIGAWEREPGKLAKTYADVAKQPGAHGHCYPASAQHQGYSTTGNYPPVPLRLAWSAYTFHATEDLRWESRWDVAAGDSGRAHAESGKASFALDGVPILTVEAASADVEVRCTAVGPPPTVTPSSRVVVATPGGGSVTVTDYRRTELPGGLGTIELNKTTEVPAWWGGGPRVTRQAVVITLANGRTTVLADASATYSGNPCRT